jgi:S1-C subfamily serine protease
MVPRMASQARFAGWLTKLVLLFALLAIGYLSLKVRRLERLVSPRSEGQARPPLIAPRAQLADIERMTTQLFRQASGSVVHITTLELHTDPFELNVLEVPKGTGSGFVWDEQGDIVTNFHVVQGGSGARVTLEDQSVWDAQLVGFSRRHDLAVLKIVGAASRARPLPIGTSRDLLVGQMVIAIGSPFGLDYTLSTGVISGLGREIPGMNGLPIHGAIQTDAAINPGNSGGPLLDSAGRLIGINTAIFSPSGASAGVGFAVPVDTVTRIVPQLIRFGREVRPVLGVELAEDNLARRFGLRGALVLKVTPGSPAAKAGIRETIRELPSGRIRLGDVIVSLDGAQVGNATELYGALDNKQPGDHATLGVLREGQASSIEIVLGSNVEEEG